MNTERSGKRSPADLAWFKSSYSGTSGGECVEVAMAAGAVRVRDSKDRQGPDLRFAADGWAAFLGFAQSTR